MPTPSKVLNFSFRNRSNSSPASPMGRPAGNDGSSYFTPTHTAEPARESPHPTPSRRSTSGQRPASIIGAPMMGGPLIDTSRSETEKSPPELVRIFKYLGGHTQKIYHEGYFQKLNDLNPDGSPVTNRVWNDCYAQLIGTVLSIWDDRALEEAEERMSQGYPPHKNVPPSFINLTDATLKMIPSLAQKSQGRPLTNVLSISTAGQNRYLFHFAAHHDLTQWTGAIRLAMYENNSLQEAYTGALIAAKGPALNSIKDIIERTRFQLMDWTRVRFGAGKPWRRCWTVITPPEEKAYQKRRKAMSRSKMNASDFPPVLGSIKFYESKKMGKKVLPIATVTSAYSAYAIYPESKALIDQSTLMKIEGEIVFHTNPAFTTEGFVFMMPEHHPGVSGFEMLLRFLMPTFDCFNLYGRPERLAADAIDARSLMFAFPKENKREYGYLELLDVVGLLATQGQSQMSEAQWKKSLKDLTSKRMMVYAGSGKRRSMSTHTRTSSLQARNQASSISFGGSETPSRVSTNSARPPMPTIMSYGPDAPINGYSSSSSTAASTPPLMSRNSTGHKRSVSVTAGYNKYEGRGVVPTSERLSASPAQPDYPPPALPQPQLEQVPTPPAPQQHRPVPSRLSSYQSPMPTPYHKDFQDDTGKAYGDYFPNNISDNNVARSNEYEERNPSSPFSFRLPSPDASMAPPVPAHNYPTSPNRLSNGTMALMFDGANQSGAEGRDPRDYFYVNRTQSSVDSSHSSQSEESRTGRDSTAVASRTGAMEDGHQDAGSYERMNAGIQQGSQMSTPPSSFKHNYLNSNQNFYQNQPSPSGSPKKSPMRAPAHNGNAMASIPLHLQTNSSNSDIQSSRLSQQSLGSSNLSSTGYTDETEDMRNKFESSRIGNISQLPPLTRPKSNTFSHHQGEEVSRAARGNIQVQAPVYNQRKPVPVRVKASSPTKMTAQKMYIDNQYMNEAGLSAVQSQPISMSDMHLDQMNQKPVLIRTQTNNSGSVYYEDVDDFEGPKKTLEHLGSRRMDDDPPRTGVMKTVGNPEPVRAVKIGEAVFAVGPNKEPTVDMPEIDFGPTIDLRAAPSKPELLTNKNNKPQQSSNVLPRVSPTPSHDRSQQPSPVLYDHANGERRRSIAWQPGLAQMGPVPNQSPVGSYDAHDFVEPRNQRKASYQNLYQAGQPSPRLTQHQRIPSNQNLYQIGRSPSQEQLGTYSSRPQSRNELSRPQSRNALDRPQSRNALDRPASRQLLNRPGSRGDLYKQDYTSRLTAHEQEYIARATGTPLLGTVPVNKKQASIQSTGLLATMEVREREKKEIKEGRANYVVQQAIQQRTLHQRSSSQNLLQSMPGSFPQTPPATMVVYPASAYGMPMQQQQLIQGQWSPEQIQQMQYQQQLQQQQYYQQQGRY